MSRRLKALALGSAVAVTAYLVAGTVLWWLREGLPERIAIHWGVRGTADRFIAPGEIAVELLWTLGVSLALGVLVTVLVPSSGAGSAVPAGLTAGTGTFMAVMVGGVIAVQAGGAEPSEAPVALVLLVGSLVGVSVGVLATRLVGPLPARPPATGVPPPSQRLPESDRTRTWRADLSLHPAWLLLVVLPLPAFVILGVAMSQWQLPVIASLLVAVPLVVMWRWRVVVDTSGLRIAPWVGWPSYHHPLDSIERAETRARVEALEFGGPGLRVTPGGTRLVQRAAPGLRVLLSDGTDLIIATDEANRAAVILNTLVAEDRG